MIIKAQHCISGEPYFDKYVMSQSEPGKVYAIRIIDPEDTPDEWMCSCPSFIYRGFCKHIDMVAQEGLCRWHELIGPEIQTKDQKEKFECPSCGNKTVEELEEDGKS